MKIKTLITLSILICSLGQGCNFVNADSGIVTLPTNSGTVLSGVFSLDQQLDNSHAFLMKTLNYNKSLLDEKVSLLKKTYSTNTNYLILQCLGVVDIDSASTIIGNEYGNTLGNLYQIFGNSKGVIATYNAKLPLVQEGKIPASQVNKTDVMLEISNYSLLGNKIVNDFFVNVSSDLTKLESDLLQYIVTNKQLLDNINEKKSSYEEVLGLYTIFQKDLDGFVKSLSYDVFENVTSSKKNIINTFTKTVDGRYDDYESRFQFNETYLQELKSIGDQTVKDFESDWNAYISSLLSQIYGDQSWVQIAQKINELTSSFKQSGKFNCKDLLVDSGAVLVKINEVKRMIINSQSVFLSTSKKFSDANVINTILAKWQIEMPKKIDALTQLHLNTYKTKVVELLNKFTKQTQDVSLGLKVLKNSSGTIQDIVTSGQKLIELSPSVYQKNEIITYLHSKGYKDIRLLVIPTKQRFEQKLLNEIKVLLLGQQSKYATKNEFISFLSGVDNRLLNYKTRSSKIKKLVLHIREAIRLIFKEL